MRDVLTCDIGDSVELLAIFTTAVTRGSIVKGSNVLTIEDASGYASSDPILVAGAGPLGSDLLTTIFSLVGSEATLTATASTSVVASQVGKRTDPTDVTIKVREPDGVIVPVADSPVQAGVFLGTFDPTKAGDHYWGGEGTGTAKARSEQLFVVRERRVT